MNSAIRQANMYLNLTGYYLARGWALWFVRRTAGVLCCLVLMVMLPIMAYRSGRLQNHVPAKVASASLVAGESEELEPVASVINTSAAQAVTAPAAETQTHPMAVFSRLRRPGNTYVYGQCTFYVAQRRTDVPTGWGHARSWYYNAQRAGWKTSTTPVPGAIAWTPLGYYGHVAIVERVEGPYVVVSEMNYTRWNYVNERMEPASYFKYIY